MKTNRIKGQKILFPKKKREIAIQKELLFSFRHTQKKRAKERKRKREKENLENVPKNCE